MIDDDLNLDLIESIESGLLAITIVLSIGVFGVLSLTAIHVMGLRKFITVHGGDCIMMLAGIILSIALLFWKASTKLEIEPEHTCEETEEEHILSETPIEYTITELTYHEDTPIKEDTPVKADTEKGETVDSFLEQLQKINKNFLDADILRNVLTMKSILQQIKCQINLYPGLADNATKFLNRYMPTTLQLLASYVSMNQQMYVNESTIEAKESVEESVEMMISALAQQLDSIQNMNALDVTTSSEAIQSMLALNGYGSNPFSEYTHKQKM